MLLGCLRYLKLVIDAAHNQGYYVITADYLPNGDKIFKLGEYVHPYEQTDEEPGFKFVPKVASNGGWHITLERDAFAYPEVDNTIKAFVSDRIYNMRGNLEVKDLMNFAQALTAPISEVSMR